MVQEYQLFLWWTRPRTMPCYDIEQFDVLKYGTDNDPVINLDNNNDTSVRPSETEGLKVGDWCAVTYDDIPYPGKVLEINDDGDIMVDCMKRIGKDEYAWPCPRRDIAYYLWAAMSLSTRNNGFSIFSILTSL